MQRCELVQIIPRYLEFLMTMYNSLLTFYFINFSDNNIYEATVIDRMHHLDLGLFKHQINFILDLLKEQYGASILDKINNRLTNIPRFLGLKIFKNGISSLVRITADEYCNIMKVMIFVLDNLNISKTIQEKLLKLYEVWNNMYILSRYEEFAESDLNDFEVCKYVRNLAN